MRIISGRFKGRSIAAPPGDRTRPTTDRVREAVFSILGDIAGSAVLDLYAGTGALGLEALSRGAARAVFVEVWPRAQSCIRNNVKLLGLEADTTVIGMPVERALEAVRGAAPFDLVFCDPPWPRLAEASATLGRLLAADLLSPSALLVLEHPADEPFDSTKLGSIELSDRRRWGDTGVSFFRRANVEPV